MKRFTEALKWRDPWFRGLSVDGKLAFFYLVDNCDAAGVWEPDFPLANFCLKRDVAWDEVRAEFADRLQVLSSGRWYLTRFITFQYGELTEACAPHKNVIKLLGQHGINGAKGKATLRLPLANPSVRVQEKDKEKEEDKERLGVTAEQIYQAYPKRIGKQDALRAIKAVIKRDSPQAVLDATICYAKAVAEWKPDDQKFVPHPSTWFNRGSYDDDPATWRRKNGTSPGVNYDNPLGP